MGITTREATLRHKLAVLDQHCADVGRDPAEVERTLSTRQAPDQSVDEFIDHCRTVADMAIGHVVLHSGAAWTAESVRGCADVVDALAHVPASRP